MIVQTRGEPGTAHLAAVRGLGGRVKRTYAAIHGYAATLPAWRVAQIAGDDEVETVSSDAPVKAHLDVAVRSIRADLVWSGSGVSGGGLTGKGIGIAVIDTGVQMHPDLKRSSGSRQIVEVEIVGHESGLADYYGHGTHVTWILYGKRLRVE